MRLRCYECQKSVSSEVPEETVVRAWMVCPECIEQMDKDGRLRLNDVPAQPRKMNE